MISIHTLYKERAAIAALLQLNEQYWAHLPAKGEEDFKQPEKLFEHCDLVNEYFEKLCDVHGLEPVIDRLILNLTINSFKKESKINDWIKQLFVNTIAFHDFGKVNEDFQASRMRNLIFKPNPQSPFTPAHGHSWLGAYIYVGYFLTRIEQDKELDESELQYLTVLIWQFSYAIIKHHSPFLDEVKADVHKADFGRFYAQVQYYLQLYKFSFEQSLSAFVFDDFESFWTEFERRSGSSFALFALLKLNFSLLTASDYLATHEYMSGDVTHDLGVLNDRNRIETIIQNLRQFEHNKDTFEQLKSGYVFQEKALQEKSKANLNKLRREMAIELLQTIRKFSDKRLYFIEAPTGGGKTNLSMIALTELLDKNPELRKVFYVFPFTTLITQTYKAVQATLQLTNLELVELHSKAGFQSKSEAKKEDDVYGRDKKDYIDNLFALYPITLLSHVRFFDILKTNSKEANYLLHRLANSVVIIDEIQSYNPKIWDKMLYFISQYAETFNIRFILMSATLPKLDKLDLKLRPLPVFQELLPNARKYLQNPNFAERVRFNFELYDRQLNDKDENDWSELAKTVIDKSKQFAEQNTLHGSVHTIIEFIYKKSASTFKQVIGDSDCLFDEIFVLSGTILEFRRRQIINQLKNPAYRRKNILLITTQVVEAGVDIDMDLGFKNISLLDSDEQLAGRVNRNASKGLCEVYLFRLDDSRILYGSDYRYKVIQEGKISKETAQEILSEKRFDKLYQEVFSKIDGFNKGAYADNFSGEILDHLNRLNFTQIDRNFRLIDQQNESVFVPIDIPAWVESSEESKSEAMFSEDDLAFLIHFGAYRVGDEFINGESVWKCYERFIWQDIANRKVGKGFDLNDRINFKTLQSILGKFTFSLMTHSNTIDKMKSFCLNADTTYGYWYLSHHDKVYKTDTGLMEDAFDDSANSFL
ncbi:CRISPR-associated helicase Cas3' [Spirosoma endbachense]|uniref:CRISPR-associated helicase Cas3 n=1 Tax=Spirosoma endbachense TaxID=2666025 RepID=A0A6P1VXU8_9BACT|nr:CRISPR-associated helicase Cas3' [Spirosoma endbachense]QHV96650.1 CRISPR-associated helicase Cas3' [Spirosoma endbachense]